MDQQKERNPQTQTWIVKDLPTELEIQDQGIEELIETIDTVRDKVMALMANPHVDASQVEWMVTGINPRVAGSQFTKASPKMVKYLSGNELKVYLNNAMHQHTKGAWCMTSIQTKAKETGLSRATIYRTLAHLVERNVLHKRTTRSFYRKGAFIQLPHWYRVNDPSQWKTPVSN